MRMDNTPLREPWLQAIARVFAEQTVYAVGGAVRNTLMGLPVSDVDLCGAARPDEVLKRCEGTAVAAKPRAAHFGTVELHVDGHMAEYTTFRRDSYRGGHRPFEVRFADTAAEDAFRRDFSVNALYAPLSEPDKIIDPTGGLRHLKERVLHTVTDDPDQVLQDDGLRILRAARFQAELNFTPTDAVLLSAEKHAHLLDEIAAERKRDELTRLLTADTKYPALSRTAPPVSTGLTTLVRVGAWPKLFGCLAPVNFTVMDHTETLNICGKFALLYHRETPDALAKRMGALRYAKREIKAAYEALSALRAVRDSRSETADALQFGLRAMETAKAMLAALAVADAEYRAARARAEETLKRIAAERLPVSVHALAVGGGDLLGLCRETGMPEERIGGTLAALWRDVVNGRVPNRRGALLAWARRRLIDSQNGG
jgi:tRNA nucleotidyltransferase/poly(A) polymerase